MALIEIVAQGANEQYLSGTRTLWGPIGSYTDGYKKSSHEIMDILHPIASYSDPTSHSFTWSVPRHADIVGDFFLRFKSVTKSVFDDIMSIEYQIGGQVIERYNGEALRMLSTFDPRARPSFQSNVKEDDVAMDAVVPLRLCTSTGSTHNYLPIIRLRFHEVTVKVHFNRRVENPVLLASYIFLDTDERRNLCHKPVVDLRISQKISLSEVVTTVDSNSKKSPILIDLSCISGNVRDLVMSIRGSNGQKIANEPLLGMRLLMTDEKHQRQMSMDGLMARSVIPRQYYGIEDTSLITPPIYFMPFDHTPLLHDDTASMNFGRANPVHLELKLVPDDTYKIDIMIRTVNLFRTQNGIGSLRIPSYFPALPISCLSVPCLPPVPCLPVPCHNDEKSVTILNVDSAIVTAIREALVEAGIIRRGKEKDAYTCAFPPALYPAPLSVLNQLQRILKDSGQPHSRVIGTQVSVGTTDKGMHEHRDASYQVDSDNSDNSDNSAQVYTLLVYLTDVSEGGETVFVCDDGSVETRVKPRVGKAVMFCTQCLHRTLPVYKGHKIIIAAEVTLSLTTVGGILK